MAFLSSPSSYLSWLLLFLCLTSVSAHSELMCTSWNGTVPCPPENWPYYAPIGAGNKFDIRTGAGLCMPRPTAESDQIWSSTPLGSSIGQASPGDIINLAWPANNHAQEKNQPISIYMTTESHPDLSIFKTSTPIAKIPFNSGPCQDIEFRPPAFTGPICNGTFQVPSDASGTVTFIWAWPWFAAEFENYQMTSCFQYQISSKGKQPVQSSILAESSQSAITSPTIVAPIHELEVSESRAADSTSFVTTTSWITQTVYDTSKPTPNSNLLTSVLTLYSTLTVQPKATSKSARVSSSKSRQQTAAVNILAAFTSTSTSVNRPSSSTTTTTTSTTSTTSTSSRITYASSSSSSIAPSVVDNHKNGNNASTTVTSFQSSADNVHRMSYIWMYALVMLSSTLML